MLSKMFGWMMKRAKRTPLPLLSWALLGCLVAAGPVLADTVPTDDAKNQRRARAEAWRAEQEARQETGSSTYRLAENGRLVPQAVGGELPPPGASPNSAVIGGDLGGEEAMVDALTTRPKAMLEITSAGVIYVAAPVGELGFGPAVVNIFRSADGGNTFTLWSAFTNPDPEGILDFDDFIVVEGASNRAIVAYSAGVVFDSSIRVAWAELTPTTPTWNHVTVAPAGGPFYRDIDLATDASEYAEYFVYLSATAWISTSNGSAVWFSRSQDMGTSWDAGYAVASNPWSSPRHDAHWSEISYGRNGYVHLAYHTVGEGITKVNHRRTGSWGDLGLPGWSAPTVIVEGVVADGDFYRLLAMEASHGDDTVLIHRDHKEGSLDGGTHLQWSTDGGATWPAANDGMTGVQTSNDINTMRGAISIDPANGSVWILGHNPTTGSGEDGFQTQSTTLTAPGTLSAPEFWVGPEYAAPVGPGGDIAVDPSRGGQRAVVWQAVVGSEYQVFFDAEWFDEAGWPNTEVGFPIPVAGIGRTPPAIADVDDDPFGEIVFATEEGIVYVVNHDGTNAAGWPVALNENIAWDSPVAVGDLDGDDVPEIVIGTAVGRVFAYRSDGSIMPGWPVDLGTGADTFVSIGALGPPYPRYVVACSGHVLKALKYDGGDMSPNWGTAVGMYLRPAAIGDVDGDGIGEIISRQTGSIHVHRLDTSTALAFRLFPGETLSGMPALVDMDEDGDLEIAVGTIEGKVYLMHHDFSDYSASFPYDTGNNSPVVGVVPVDLLGTDTPELVFSQVDGTTHIVRESGVPGAFYPNTTAPGAFVYMPPIVATVHPTSPDVVVSGGASLYCWENLGAVPDGWPRHLGDFIEESAAAGDIDLDGRTEIVALGLDQLRVFDVGFQLPEDRTDMWPMYGYNAQRTGCLDCFEGTVSAVDDPLAGAPSRLAFAPPFPNPASARTALSYALPTAAQVRLQIFDVRGRLVRTLTDGQQDAGYHEAFWNGTGASGRRVALGLYLAKLSVRGPGVQEDRVQKISLVR